MFGLRIDFASRHLASPKRPTPLLCFCVRGRPEKWRIGHWGGEGRQYSAVDLFERRLSTRRDATMGDKGGKKDKDKSKKQKAAKQDQSSKAKKPSK
jgi:hypothetical protein